LLASTASAWEPTKQVTFVIPAGTGGGADQMARFIQGVVTKHNLMSKPLVVINKSGGAGAEGFLDVKSSPGDPHKIIITLSNLFTTPLATGESPYKSAKDYLNAVKGGSDGQFKMGGTGSKQEDQIITVALEKVTGKKFTYVPYKGGGEVAVQLVGNHINSSVNNPIEAVAQWRAGALRPLCVFDDQRLNYKQKMTDTMSWADIPTCKESGVDVDYLMLRGIFMPSGVKQDQVDYYVNLLKKVRETPEWKEFMEKGAFNQSFMTGAEYRKWVEEAEKRHHALMKDAGFLAKTN
jgi:tripartite-type tricarboxylate transporter receptor subunit TctC